MRTTTRRRTALVCLAALIAVIATGSFHIGKIRTTQGGIWPVEVAGTDGDGSIYAMFWRKGSVNSVGEFFDYVTGGTHLPPGPVESVESARHGHGSGEAPEITSQGTSAAAAWIAANRTLERPIEFRTVTVVSGDLADSDHPYADYAGVPTYSPGDGTIRIGSMDSPTYVDDLSLLPLQRMPIADVDQPALTVSAGLRGPSAGVAYYLRYLEHLSGLPVAPGLRVAATGTISVNGFVGEVGGITEKVRAAVVAGVDVVIVPRGNEVDAHAAVAAYGDPAEIAVVAVSTTKAVLAALCGFVGTARTSVSCAATGDAT